MQELYDGSHYKEAIADLWQSKRADALGPGAPQPGIAAGLFSEIVRKLREPPNHRCRVVGKTDWSDFRFRRKLVVRGIRFDGDVEADAAVSAGVDFLDCVFAGKLHLRNCRIGSSLRLVGCSFPGAAPAMAEPRLVLGGTHIKGKLVLEDIDIEGRCSLAGIVVGGDLRITGLRATAPAQETCLNLDNARIAGRILVTAGADPGGRIHLAGSVSAQGAGCHSLEMTGLVIDGACALSGLQVETNLTFTETIILGDLALYHLQCGHVTRFGLGCEVHGLLNLDGARIAAQLNVSAGIFEEIHINGATIGSLWVGRSADVEARSLYIINSNFASYVKLSRFSVVRARLGGHRLAQGAPAPGLKQAPEHRRGTIEFEHCGFGSLVTTWPVIRYDGDDGWQAGSGVTVELGFSFTDCTVNGQLHLTRLVVSDPDAGFIRLDRTRLRGALFISSALAIAKRQQMPPDVRSKARAIHDGGTAGGYRARARSLSMREFAASAVELSGLDLVKRGNGDRSDGTLEGDRVQVKGRFETYVFEARGDPPSVSRAHVDIGGALRLRAAKIGELHLDSLSFRQRGGCIASLSGVVLELAEIGLLRVPRDRVLHRGGVNTFPVPLDLSGVTIVHWNFEEDVDADSPATADDFLDFLDNDENLHREVYRSVALSLRNAGSDEDAERILYAEEYRARWESRQRKRGKSDRWPIHNWRDKLKGRHLPTWKVFGWLEPIVRRVDRILLQYRRNTINLLYVILLLFMFSAFLIASHPSNFEMAQTSRIILQQQSGRASGLASGLDYEIRGTNVGPREHDWGIWKSFWMAARYHVPIVAFTAREEYVASNDNELEFGLGRLTTRWTWLTAEDWFAGMTILNWIMWPLLLTFALRRALRSD
ncbi:MAG: hypothetical protein QOG13_1608 [Sphingomonadales bacterium]|jgi:hypothetical protein|nr:hypothetical protein [Sphingomonadales bacterium]MEA3042333.1 hypothetical protein [Sphingomonadales bacterium]